MNQGTLNFLDSEENQKKIKRQVGEAPSSNQGQRLTVSGTYVMEVDTGFYYDKDKMIHYVPDITESSKKSIMLTLRLKVVDPTLQVKVGETLLTNVTILPKKGATEEEARRTFSLAKPRLVAMLGTDKVDLFDKKWIVENLLAEFKVDGEKQPMIVRDHKMKSKVLVVVEDDISPDGKPQLKVKSISPATSTDKSVSNTAAPGPAERKDDKSFEKSMSERSEMSDAPKTTNDEAAIDALVDNSGVQDIATSSEDFPT